MALRHHLVQGRRTSHTLSVWPVLVAAALVAGPSAAQSPKQTEPTEPKGSQSITVEGCLTKEGNAQRSSAAEQFVLTIAAAPASKPAVPPTGTKPPRQTMPAPTSPPGGGAVPAPPQKRMFALRSAPDAKHAFQTMVNQLVRVTGTTTAGATTAPLAGRSPEATPYQAPVSAPGQTSGATGTPFDATNLPTLVVQTITSVASQCR